MFIAKNWLIVLIWNYVWHTILFEAGVSARGNHSLEVSWYFKQSSQEPMNQQHPHILQQVSDVFLESCLLVSPKTVHEQRIWILILPDLTTHAPQKDIFFHTCYESGNLTVDFETWLLWVSTNTVYCYTDLWVLFLASPSPSMCRVDREHMDHVAGKCPTVSDMWNYFKPYFGLMVCLTALCIHYLIDAGQQSSPIICFMLEVCVLPMVMKGFYRYATLAIFLPQANRTWLRATKLLKVPEHWAIFLLFFSHYYTKVVCRLPQEEQDSS